MRTPLLYPRSFKGFIFDWDGVIAETRLDFSLIRERFFGGRRVPLIEGAKTLPPPERDAVMEAVRAEEMRGAALSTPVPGASALISQLDLLGIPWCVMSRNCRESIDAAAQAIGFTLPPLTWGREAEFVKPDPRAFSSAAAAMGVCVSDCLVIGDFLYELMGARRAGARCVLVNRRDEECESYADASFATLAEFAAVYAEDRPLVPWEYRRAAESCGVGSLVAMHKKCVVVDRHLDAKTLQLLENLASRGLGTLQAPQRNVTAAELADTPGLAPSLLGRPLRDALAQLMQARYPLLTIEDGADGVPLSQFEAQHE